MTIILNVSDQPLVGLASSNQNDNEASEIYEQGQIPELKELQTRLQNLKESSQYRGILQTWLTELSNPGNLKLLDADGQPRRRWRKDIELDEAQVREWVEQLDTLLNVTESHWLHLSLAARTYNIELPVLSTWQRNGLMGQTTSRGNKIMINEKPLVIAQTINRRFGGSGSRIVPFAMTYFHSLKS